MTNPVDGVYTFSPAFSIVCTGGLATPTAPTVSLFGSSATGSAVTVYYRIMSFLDGGMNFHSAVSASATWSGGVAKKEPIVTVQWSAVPYARAYAVWRSYQDGATVTREKLIYFGSGRNIFSGRPDISVPSKFWGQNYFLWDHLDATATANGTLAMGKDVAVPGTANAARGSFTTRDLRRISSTAPAVHALLNELEHEDVSDSLEDNINRKLAGFKSGQRVRFPVLFQYGFGGTDEQAVIDLWNAEQAYPDDPDSSSFPGLRLFVSLGYDTSSASAEDHWSPIAGWAPCRIVAPKQFVRRPAPGTGDGMIRGETPMTFEIEDPAFTVPYPFDWGIGRPLYL